MQACQFGGDIFDTELILRAERTGLTVREMPVSVADQRPPRTPIIRRIPAIVAGSVAAASGVAAPALSPGGVRAGEFAGDR